jgi:hypothetical protein
VYVAAGQYHESVDAATGVAIIGGFDPATWALSAAPTSIDAPAGARQAVLADGDRNVVLARLTLNGPPGKAGSVGEGNSFGLRAIRNSSVALLAVRAYRRDRRDRHRRDDADRGAAIGRCGRWWRRA